MKLTKVLLETMITLTVKRLIKSFFMNVLSILKKLLEKITTEQKHKFIKLNTVAVDRKQTPQSFKLLVTPEAPLELNVIIVPKTKNPILNKILMLTANTHPPVGSDFAYDDGQPSSVLDALDIELAPFLMTNYSEILKKVDLMQRGSMGRAPRAITLLFKQNNRELLKFLEN